MSLGQLVDSLQREYGAHYYGRIDMHLSNDVKDDAMRRATARPEKIGRFVVTRIEDMDGMKFFFDTPNNGNGADAWVLIRASGTEPLLRVYSEASSPGLVQQILAEAEKFVHQRA
jgi:phosphomannomutase